MNLSVDFRKLTASLEEISQKAGEAIKEIYESNDYTVESKIDKTPVTQADLKANEIITKSLTASWSWPIHSEEDPISWETRKSWQTFWLVDPLDGTKGFVKRKSKFTVNIALIHEGQPVAGVVQDPQTNDVWVAARGLGSFKNGQSIYNRNTHSNLVATTSKDHPSDETKEFLESNNISKTKTFGSSIKFCYLAQGLVDIYPRLSPTSEWDTAAGQIVCEEAGCEVIDMMTQKPLSYGKKDVVNNSFLAYRKNLKLKF